MKKKIHNLHDYLILTKTQNNFKNLSLGLFLLFKKTKPLEMQIASYVNNHRDVKNIDNIVNNIIITMYGARWVLDLG